MHKHTGFKANSECSGFSKCLAAAKAQHWCMYTDEKNLFL